MYYKQKMTNRAPQLSQRPTIKSHLYLASIFMRT